MKFKVLILDATGVKFIKHCFESETELNRNKSDVFTLIRAWKISVVLNVTHIYREGRSFVRPCES